MIIPKRQQRPLSLTLKKPNTPLSPLADPSKTPSSDPPKKQIPSSGRDFGCVFLQFTNAARIFLFEFNQDGIPLLI
jgi:hypothetical protein